MYTKSTDIDWTKYNKNKLDLLKQYLGNGIMYDIFKNNGFKLNNKFYKLDSNINVFESVFIYLIINAYHNTIKSTNINTFNILEVGLARGTSAVLITTFLNTIQNYNILYTIIDMNQSTQWNNIGLNNVKQYLKKHITLDFHENSSTIIIPKLTNKYNIIFIDGSHDEKIVYLDLINSDKLLKEYGIIIIDDVLHKGVKKALIKFMNNYKYDKIIIDKTTLKIQKFNKLYPKIDYFIDKQNIFNPCTMFAIKKL